MFEKVLDQFNKYISNYDMKEKGIALKYNHSLAVMNLMGELAFRLNLSDEEIKLARVIGLLHDIGRFEQWHKYKSFSAIQTGFDHGEYGADYLFKDGHIRDFIDDSRYDSVIDKAIRYHNKLTIPNDLDEKELLFSKMIRDMDKVDIYKVDATDFVSVFDAKEITQEILEDLKNEKVIDIKKRKTKTDSTLITLSFIYDINFNETFDILVETDNFDLFLSTVEVNEDSEKLWKKIREICFDKINRGVENVR